jgi:hypothetical protein
VYPSAIFILLIAAELLRGVRAGRVGLAIAAAVTVAAVISGLWFLRLGYRENLEPASEGVRARLAAIEISRQTVDPRLVVLSGLAIIHVGSYLSAVDAFGSPAYSERELASSPEPARIAADQTLRGALGISLGPAKRDSPASSAAGGSASGCRALKASPTGGTGIELHPGEFTLRDRSAPGAVVQLARYSGPPSVSLGALPPGRDVSLKIPADQSIRPWRVVFRGNGQITFCVAGSG